MTINTENVRAWVDALRSGAYQQGRLALRTPDDKFCCLGVACDVSGLGEWDTDPESRELNYVIKDELDNVVASAGAYLPSTVSEWLGIDNGGTVKFEDTSAVHANDVLQWDFDKIADAIEATFLKPGVEV